MRHTLFHTDTTHATHHEAATFLSDLLLDVDFLRIGVEPLAGGPLTVERLDQWETIAHNVRHCWRAAFRPQVAAGHAKAVAWVSVVVSCLRESLRNSTPPWEALPPDWQADWKASLAAIEACREESKRY